MSGSHAATAVLPVPQWVISDTHLGHANILTYCPWRQTWAKDVQQHDAVLINAWNQVVGLDDWVLHLGDVALGSKERVAAFRSRLMGHICLILGNHDRTRTSMLQAGFERVESAGEIRIGGDRWVCCHDPALVTPDMAAGARRVLHGHCHGNLHRGSLPGHLRDFAIDCGIDALRSVAPAPWQQVK